MPEEPRLSTEDHELLAPFLKRVLVGFRDGEITLGAASSGLAHMLAAVDIGTLESSGNGLGRKG